MTPIGFDRRVDNGALGLVTRLAALGMIGFTLAQSSVDISFHGVEAKTIGAWFDRLPDAAILDQRLLWVFLLPTLAVKGAGRCRSMRRREWREGQ